MELDKAGVATAVLCSTPFVAMAKAEAAALGLPDLPIIVVDHPLGGQPPDVVEVRADQAISRLLEAVTAGELPLEARG
ncbi:MAG: hypothetical protein HY329_11970 [Chloroflexi bacterium]|nr:hypothetical protein [Chloroflexota bacterium]